ncbi:MAG: hypothetical protein ABSG44_15375 [Thermodesulfobacteriota bacterium]|jgi:hypothetical protein
MKLLLKAALMNIALLLVISSWATITEGTEGYFKGDFQMGGDVQHTPNLKLISMDIPQSWDLSTNMEYWATIKFDADRDQKIQRACFNFSGGSRSCVDVQEKDVSYGLHPHFRVSIRIPAGSKRIECYAEYIQNGETQRTNTITYYLIILKKE